MWDTNDMVSTKIPCSQTGLDCKTVVVANTQFTEHVLTYVPPHANTAEYCEIHADAA